MDLFERMKALNTVGAYRAPRVTVETALAGGRHPVLPDPKPHVVLGTPLTGPWREGQAELVVGMGCYWGAERLFWATEGVESTAVGFAGGYTPNPTYRETCTGRTGHTEAVRIVYDPQRVSTAELLRIMFENHDPTQGDRQGNDVGSQYRSAVYALDAEQLAQAEKAVEAWQPAFTERGFGPITTDVALLADTPAGEFYLAEDEHQQYLAKNPDGYCNHGPNGVSCQTGVLG